MLYYRPGLPACMSEGDVLVDLGLASGHAIVRRRRRDWHRTLLDLTLGEAVSGFRHGLGQTGDEVLLTLLLLLLFLGLTSVHIDKADGKELRSVDTATTAVVLTDGTDERLTVTGTGQGQAIEARQLDLLGLSALDADLTDQLDAEIGVDAVVLTNVFRRQESTDDTDLDTICELTIVIHLSL